MKIAANLSLLLNEYPLLERVRAAAAAGFSGVEVQFPYEHPAIVWKEALERAGLPLVLINLPAGDLMSGGAGLACVPGREAEFEAALQQALTFAAMTRPQWVNVLAGRLLPGVSFEQAQATLIRNLQQAAQAFQTLGIGVLVEAINPLDMPGFLLNTPEQLQQALQAVNHPNLFAQYDLYHMARQQLDIEAGIALLGDRIGHVQFADFPGRGAPGTGRIDFPAAVSALRRAGYRDWLSAEYQGGPGESWTWLQDWQQWLAEE